MAACEDSASRFAVQEDFVGAFPGVKFGTDNTETAEIPIAFLSKTKNMGVSPKSMDAVGHSEVTCITYFEYVLGSEFRCVDYCDSYSFCNAMSVSPWTHERSRKSPATCQCLQHLYFKELWTDASWTQFDGQADLRAFVLG